MCRGCFPPVDYSHSSRCIFPLDTPLYSSKDHFIVLYVCKERYWSLIFHAHCQRGSPQREGFAYAFELGPCSQCETDALVGCYTIKCDNQVLLCFNLTFYVSIGQSSPGTNQSGNPRGAQIKSVSLSCQVLREDPSFTGTYKHTLQSSSLELFYV